MSAAWSDGSRLYGASIPRNQSKSAPSHPSPGGRGKANRRGKTRRQSAATLVAAGIRFTKIDNSRSVRQRNGAPIKKRSMDMYGRMKNGTNGILRSHSK